MAEKAIAICAIGRRQPCKTHLVQPLRGRWNTYAHDTPKWAKILHATHGVLVRLRCPIAVSAEICGRPTDAGALCMRLIASVTLYHLQYCLISLKPDLGWY
jgi:hypothetical protein